MNPETNPVMNPTPICKESKRQSDLGLAQLPLQSVCVQLVFDYPVTSHELVKPQVATANGLRLAERV